MRGIKYSLVFILAFLSLATLINWQIFIKRVVGQELELFPIGIEIILMLVVILLADTYRIIKLLIIPLIFIISLVGYVFIFMSPLQCIDTGYACAEEVNQSNIIYGIVLTVVPLLWALEGILIKVRSHR